MEVLRERRVLLFALEEEGLNLFMAGDEKEWWVERRRLHLLVKSSLKDEKMGW